MVVTNLVGSILIVAVPEGGSAWMYLLLASAACSWAFAWNARSRAIREEIR
jgi:hypothetical protein